MLVGIFTVYLFLGKFLLTCGQQNDPSDDDFGDVDLSYGTPTLDPSQTSSFDPNIDFAGKLKQFIVVFFVLFLYF
jgi:hypothetical protein